MIVPGTRWIVFDEQWIGRDCAGLGQTRNRAPGVAVDQVVGKHIVRSDSTLLCNSVFTVVVNNVVETSGIVVAGCDSGVASTNDDSTLAIVKRGVVGDHRIAGGVPQMDAVA